MTRLEHSFFVSMLLIGFSGVMSAQLSGTKSIPGDYATIALAFADLNAQGVGTGGVTFNVAAGHTETSSNLTLAITTNPPTASNPVVFQKSGTGANPLITAAPGVSASLDGIIKLSGTDYITFDGIDLLDPPSNNNFTTMMEWGFALLRASSTDGCQNVVIKNCTITLQKINVQSSTVFSIGIYVANRDTTGTVVNATAPAGQNSYNRFYGNVISNVYRGMQIISSSTARDIDNEIGVFGEAPNMITNWGGGNQTAEGIRCEGQINVKITNNIINGGAGTTTFINGILATLFGAAGSAPNYEISHNTVTITGGSTNLQYAIRALATGDTVRLHNNIVENCNTASSTAAFSALIHDPAGTTNAAYIHNNIVRNNTHSGTGNATLIAGIGTITNLYIYSNQVYGNQKSGASGTINCIQAATAAVECYNNVVYNNSIPNSSGTSASIVYGYINSGSPTTENVYNNTIYNLSVGGSNTSASSIVAGIRSNVAAGTNKEIRGNTIYGLSGISGTSTTGGVYGVWSTAGTSTKIHKNNIYDLLNTGTTGTTAGIWVTSGTAIEVYNNFISDVRTPNSTNANAVIGINSTSTATNSTLGIYYNTVYLNASGGSTFGSSGVSVAGNATSTTAALDMRNNIIVNVSTPGSTSGLTVAYRRSNANLANYQLASNNNLFYAGTPSANRLIFHDGTNSDQLIDDFKARVSPRDVASFSELPPFVNTSTAPYNLHINPTIATGVESGGVIISGIETDFDGDTRFGAPGYTGTGFAPDVGADELEGTPLVPMVYVSSTSTQNTDAVFANTVNNHIIGIEIVTTGSSNPLEVTSFTLNTNGSTNAAGDITNAKLFYTGASNTFSTALQYGSTFSSPPPAPSTYAITGSQTLVSGTNYFWLTYDVPLSATNGNVLDAEVLSITVGGTPQTPSVTAPAGNRSIIGSISGTFTISPSQPYPYNSFTNVAALLGSAGVSGPVVFNVDAGPEASPYNEQVEFTAIPGASATNTVTINGNGATLTFLPTNANRHLVRLNGARWMTIDNLNIVRAAGGDTAFAWGVHLMNGADYNTITNCTIDLSSGANTSLTNYTLVGIVATNSLTSVSAAGNNANYCVFANNSIQGGVNGGPQIGIRLNGNTGGVQGVGNQIVNNVIRDFHEYGIHLMNTDSTLISGNNIHRANRLAVTIFRGIVVGSGAKSTLVEKNRIHTTNAPTANPSATAYGIHFDNADAPIGRENVAANNMIYNFNSTSGIIYGIYNLGSDGAHCYFNSISLDDNVATGGTTRGFFQSTVATNVVFKNNIISITRAGTGAKHCLYFGTPGSDITSNHNLLYINAPAGSNSVGFLSIAYATLAAWQTTGHDLNSVDGAPGFVNLMDLHIVPTLNPPSPASNAGTPIAGITDDFDGDPRDPSTPDIGADEFVVVPSSVTVAVPVEAGWNMISNPVTRATGTDSVKQIFPTSSFPYAFRYDPGLGYQQSFFLQNKIGYWGKFPGATSTDVTGGPRMLDTLPVVAGWNMVGSISYSVDTSTITSNPPGLKASAWFGYSAGYVPATHIIPGKGYWIKSTGPGEFYFASSGPRSGSKKSDSGIGSLEALNTLTITDAHGGAQTLYFGAPVEGLNVAWYELPPLPPSEVFDARFVAEDGGFLVQTHDGAAGEFPIAIQSSAYPLTISWELRGASGEVGYVLSDAFGGEIFGVQTLAGSGSVVVENSSLNRLMLKVTGVEALPEEYALWQNYPNPFNPTTNIKFALPVDGEVTVAVYNLLGQKVRTLVNEQRPAGYHVVEWNGRGEAGQELASGVYFVRVSATGVDGSKFSSVRKLMMMK